MKRFLILILLMAFMTTGGAIFAKKQPPKTRVIDFSKGDTIKTEYFKPNQMSVEAVYKKSSKSFIKIRTDFIKEIIKSAEEF